MENLYLEACRIINNMKSGEKLYRYCFWDNFISSKKLKRITTKTGDEFEDEWNDEQVLLLAGHIQELVNEPKITTHHFYALLNNEGRKKLTKTKQRMLKGAVMYHCLKFYDGGKCVKCGSDLITIEVRKNYMKMLGKKMIPDSSVKILKCGCSEFLEMKQDGIFGNSYRNKL